MNNPIFRAILSFFIMLYRLSKGKIGGTMQSLGVLLLNTTGRKSGKARTTPLGFFEHEGDYVIIASNGGADHHPSWFHNLMTEPKATVEIKDRKVSVVASQANPELRSKLWAQLVSMSPGYGSYEKRTTREIPVVLLHPVG
ncbi:MAG: nitroreductase family deazaflavin-dependent oxidoreductase [Anaerolineales bacterium]